MRIHVQSLVLVFTVALVSCGSSQWVEFTPIDRAFSVSFPAPPAKTETDQELPTMRLTLTHYAITTNEITFTVHFTDYPTSITLASTPETMLDPGIERMFASYPRARKESVKVAFQGFPARNFSIEDSITGYTAVGMSCLVGLRIYVIQVVRPSRISAKAEIDRFMHSFRIERKID